ncbi:MAG: YciI family protein [Maricaulaceae bacterium]|nr:YciI family protein [Maricaulaceae bacterium]
MAMKHFILFYDTAPDYLERRPEFRGAHLKLAQDAAARGELVLAGALADPPDAAVLVFKGEDKSVAEKFVAADPYVKNGLIANWRVREWTTVVGEGALTQVPAAGQG